MAMNTRKKTPMMIKKVSPETRVVRGLLAIIKRNHPNVTSESHLSDAVKAEVGILLPRMVTQWQEEQVKNVLLVPLTEAIKLRNPEAALQAMYTSSPAMEMLLNLHQTHQEKKAAEAKATAEATAKKTVADAVMASAGAVASTSPKGD